MSLDEQYTLFLHHLFVDKLKIHRRKEEEKNWLRFNLIWYYYIATQEHP